MRNLLNTNSPIMNLIAKIADSVLLNMMWLICCLPIVTAGASTTALFAVSMKMSEDLEGNLFTEFKEAFRENLRTSTKTWLILLATGILLALDGYILFHLRFDNRFWTIVTAVYFGALVIYAIIMMYVFPLMAVFENSSLLMIKNALALGVRYLVCTALMAAVYFVMLLVIVRIFTPMILFGMGLCALINSYILKGVILQLKEKASEAA